MTFSFKVPLKLYFSSGETFMEHAIFVNISHCWALKIFQHLNSGVFLTIWCLENKYTILMWNVENTVCSNTFKNKSSPQLQEFSGPKFWYFIYYVCMHRELALKMNTSKLLSWETKKFVAYQAPGGCHFGMSEAGEDSPN